MTFWELVKTDLFRAKLIKTPNKVNLKSLMKIVASRHGRIIILVRLSTENNTIISSFAKWRLRGRYFISIGQDVRIGHSFLLPHPWCIIISNSVTLGDHVTIGQYATLGGNFKQNLTFHGTKRKTPLIGDNVWVSSGAVVAGPVIIQNHVIISANAVVTKSINNNSIVYNQNEIARKKIKVLPEGKYEVTSQ